MTNNIPYNFSPRDYQLSILDALDSGCKRAVWVVHRRGGKDVTIFNWVVSQLATKTLTCFYIFPTYSQAKKAIWDAVNNDGFRILSHIPEDFVAQKNSQEMKVRFKNGSLFQLIGSDNIDCFDEKTEILTERGWVYFKDLIDTDKVGSLENGNLNFVHPLQRVQYFHDGEMYLIESKSLNALVTPNHRFFVTSTKGINKFKYISDPTIKNDKIIASSDWQGKDNPYFDFPKIVSEYTCGKGRNVRKEYSRKVYMRDFVALLGIFLAEGSTFSNYKTYRTHISQTKIHVRDKIKTLLNKMDINFCETKSGFSIEDKQLYYYFSQFGKQLDRFIPIEIKQLSKEYLQILLDWMIIGDGYNTHYYTISKKLADDVQEISIKLGFSAIIREKGIIDSEIKGRKIKAKNMLYDISIKKSNYHYLSKKNESYIKKTQYSGMVYCVSVPSGIIKVRRNGYEYWSGNSLMGTNPHIVVFSEYALQDPSAWDYIRPILRVNGGVAIFISTPRGRNHFWDMFRMARDSEEWFCELLTVKDTDVLGPEDIEQERKEGMSDELIQQEYFCSFDRGVEGSYYAKLLQKMEKEGRICDLPYDDYKVVHTAWDLGWDDATAIVFFQTDISGHIKIIDYEEHNNKTLAQMKGIIASKPYRYGFHLFPHDVEHIDGLSTGCTRKEILEDLQIPVTTVKRNLIIDGIESVKALMSSRLMISTKCVKLLKALESYHKDYDAKHKVYSNKPRHDASSHACDAVRYMTEGLSLINAQSGSLENDYKALQRFWGG